MYSDSETNKKEGLSVQSLKVEKCVSLYDADTFPKCPFSNFR